MENEQQKNLETFFKLIFGQNNGYVCTASTTAEKVFEETFWKFPDELEAMVENVQSKQIGYNQYFCPHLLSKPIRKKEYVEITPNSWADLDSCNPNNLLIPASVVLESSPGRYQAFWLFDKPVDKADAEDLSRRIAYFHKEQGADTSGWDLTQLLRIPGTGNYKYTTALTVPTVRIVQAQKTYYRLEDFADYPTLIDYTYVDEPMPDVSDINAEELMMIGSGTLSPLAWRYFNEEPQGDWSKVLWNLQMLLFEAGFTKEQVFAIALKAKCNKYVRDGRPLNQVWKEVLRASEHHKLNEKILVPEPESIVQLMSKEERDIVDRLPATFVDRYIDWASSLGDAAKQYHQAGAFVCLSSMLCGSVVLPTSFGNIVPNLWFMITADTTLTRKTTSMDIAMGIIDDVNPDAVLATDGSMEGMLTALSQRPKKPSIFLRDEFSGLLESMLKKDYMAGVAEMFTKLYDGKMQKRILRKETIDIRDPRLIIFAGGIKTKITEILSDEHISSGFIPRFVFITAESDVSRLKPIGPPSSASRNGRNELVTELTEMFEFYNSEVSMKIGTDTSNVSLKQGREFEARLTPEAWQRYNELEYRLVELGLQSTRPDLFTPIGDRLAKSILKAAVLIAASRQRQKFIIVEVTDILLAIKYGEQWRTYGEDVISGVGKSKNERQYDVVLDFIHRNEDAGVPRSRIMRNFRLNSREATLMLDTLTQRGLIEARVIGKSQLYYPVRI